MDYGSRYTDKREKMLSLRLQKVYREAQKDLEKQFDEFLKKHKKKGTEMWQKLIDGQITQNEYHSWMQRQVFSGKEWQKKIGHLTDMLKTTNEKALGIIRGEQYTVFAENANYESFTIEKDYKSAISFDIYDETTVEKLVTEKPELMPRKTVNGRKDKAWNQGVIANAVTQAIIQGESIPKLAKRLSHDTANTDMKAMVRYARTAMTCAQNAGRIETMHRAQDMDIQVQKQWLATLDRRTRDSHRHLDGQTRDVDEPFDSEYGKIMFPGDPEAHPGDVYNCRCTLVYVYPEYQNRNALRRDNENGKEIEDTTYDEWLAEKEKWQKIGADIVEQTREKAETKEPKTGRETISKQLYNQLTKRAAKEGAEIIRGGDEVHEHLKKRGATASTIGDLILLRDDATTTEVLEEIYHFRQNRRNMNGGKDARERFLLNEIDAQKYLIRVAKRYNIPERERQETRELLSDYERQLEEYRREQ